MPAPTNSDYFVVMIDLGRNGREAVVDPQHNWNDAILRVSEAMGDGQTVIFVHHIHDGVCEDRSDEAFRTVMNELSEPISATEYAWVELHVSAQAAQSFVMEAA